MNWLKDVIVDLVATAVIIAAVLTGNSFLSWLVWGYTELLVLIKFFVLIGDSFHNLIKKAKNEAPEWFSHLLYAINTGMLLGFQWWYAGAGWALIWGFSFLTQRKLKRSTV